MAFITEYLVTNPPTSGELRAKVIEAFSENGGILKLTLLGEQQVPTPEPVDVSFRIEATAHPEGDGARISGMTAEQASVVVRIPEEDGLPARASVVTVA